MRYDVYADNVGKVHSTNNKPEAQKVAKDYASGRMSGRADKHAYVLDNETNDIVAEYGRQEDQL